MPVWLYVPLVVIHVIVAIALVLIVLLQAGKGAGIGSAFGGASQTVFGPRGPGSFLGKLTTVAAGVFMITSLVIAVFSSQYFGGSVVLSTPASKSAPAPITTPLGGEQMAPSSSSTSESSGSVDAPAPQSDIPETPQEPK